MEYNNEFKCYKLDFKCYETCNCNEKIIQLFNNNSTNVFDELIVVGLAHIEYDTIKNKIKNKLHVKKIFIWPSEIYNYLEILDLNVLELLFYPEEIELLSVNYNQEFDIGNIFLKNLKDLSVSVCDETPDEISPLDCILPYVVENCPNIKDLYLERAGERGEESLEYIIQNLITFNKNLIINLHYSNNSCYDYKEEDEKYIKKYNLEKIDENTFRYKLPNIDQDIHVTISAICYRIQP